MTETSQTSWDPLEEAKDTDTDVVASAKKREISNILKSYVSNYDPFSELIQNAMDAAERRFRIDASIVPKIEIVIDLGENSLEVIDNGSGFEENEFRSFIAPSISFKSGHDTRGNKGVGITYIAYGFNDLTIRTKNPHYTFEGTIRRGRDWIEDSSGTVSRPRIEPISTHNSRFAKLDQGSSFKIIFSGEKVRPKNLSWYQATSPGQWLYLLQIKTPLGHVSLPNMDESPVIFDLTVINKDGEEQSTGDISSIYRYPHEEVAASRHLSIIVNAQEQAISKGKDPNKAIEKYRKSNGIYEIYDTEKISSFRQLDPEQISLVSQYKITAYGYFAYSTEVWDRVNDVKAQLRKGLRIIRGGLQLSSNHMVQGELITIPLTKSIGHQNQAHIIVHFQGAEPDLGRKGFQPELREVAEIISVVIVQSLSARRDVLKSDSGAQADIEKELKVHEWIKEQEKHEEHHPLVLKNDAFFLPMRKISIVSEPQSEQDVIVLFNQLVAGGVIRGVKLLSTSQTTQYDGIFRYAAEEPLSNHEFNKDTNPLGVLAEQLTKTYQTQPKVLEYKFNLNGLIKEFESGEKHESEIDLAIFWEMGDEYVKEYDVLSLLDFDMIQHRQHHGLTHILKSAHSRLDVICLRELIELLNSPEDAQKFQSERYGDGI